jgi:hypothetical protein
MKYRRVVSSDFQKMVELQNQNLYSVLSEEEQRDGVLLTAFREEDFRLMDQDLCIVVALEASEKLCGYLCASSLDPNSDFLFIRRMAERCVDLYHRGKALIHYKICIASPICIDRDHRGNLVFLKLCNALLERLPETYELAITLISVKNSKSLSSCLAINFRIIDRFWVAENEFFLLVYELDLKHQRSLNFGH